MAAGATAALGQIAGKCAEGARGFDQMPRPRADRAQRYCQSLQPETPGRD